MALDKNDLLSLVATNLPDNTSGSITPAKHRQVDEQMISAAANLAETSTQTFLGPIEFPNSFNPSDGMVIERLLEATSLATSQNPTGTGVANAKIIEFGAAQGTNLDDVQIDANGKITFNVAGLMRIKSKFHKGRTGSSGTSLLFLRYLINGTGIGDPISTKLSNADSLDYVEINNWFNVPAGATLEVEVMRDSSGNNSGGLVAISPTNEGTGTWGTAHCASIRVERLVLA